MKQGRNTAGTLTITGGDTARTGRYVSQAEKAAVRAEQSAAVAEAWAVGEKGGAPVGSTDETFHNNARHFAEQAAASVTFAQAARTAAESAKDDAEAAADSVTGSAAQIQSNKQDVHDLKSAIADITSTEIGSPYTGTIPSLSGGSINPTTGTNKQLNYACLLPYMAINEPLIYNVNLPDYEVAVWGYSDQAVAFAVRSFTNKGYGTGNILILPVNNIKYIRMGIARIDRQTMASSERATIQQAMTFSVVTDKTLSLPGKSADAYEVGAKIAELELPRFNILALGDSICKGGRNGNKGFAGVLGFPYINMGVGGACLSTVNPAYNDSIHHYPEADNIPNQLITYASKTDAEILETFGKEKFTPDIIVADGGINDYVHLASLGTLSSVPVSTDEQANALDRTTLLGGLEFLFYQMIKLYHQAQRIFVVIHKVCRANGTYYPTQQNSKGYTQKQVHDAIVECCNLYGVLVADIYNDGIMNTLFPYYKTTEDDYKDASPTDYCDKDGLHPISYGYTQVYAPIILDAIRKSGTKK